MRWIVALAFFVWWANRPTIADIGSTPFSSLTLDMLLGNLWTSILFLAAMGSTIWSIANDRVWPWRWRWNGWRDGLGRILAAMLLFSTPLLLGSTEGKWFVSLLCCSGPLVALWVLSAEKEQFKEKPMPFTEDQIP